MKWKIIGGFALAFIFNVAAQASTLIDITGGEGNMPTRPISDAMGGDTYNEALMKFKQAKNTVIAAKIAKQVEKKQMTESEAEAAMTKMVFPVATHSMTLNPNAKNTIKPTKATQPIAVVGNDEYSLNWLKENADELKRVHAMIVLVQANDISDLKKVQNISGGNEVLPLDGFPLTQTFGVKEYPAVITKSGIYH